MKRSLLSYLCSLVQTSRSRRRREEVHFSFSPRIPFFFSSDTTSFPSLFRSYFSTHLNVVSERCTSLSPVHSNRRSRRQELSFPTPLRCIVHTWILFNRSSFSLFFFFLSRGKQFNNRPLPPNQSQRVGPEAHSKTQICSMSPSVCFARVTDSPTAFAFQNIKKKNKLQSFTSSSCSSFFLSIDFSLYLIDAHLVR